MTVEQLAEATGIGAAHLRERLAEDVQRGAVVEHEGRFALAPGFAREFAPALRGVAGEEET